MKPIGFPRYAAGASLLAALAGAHVLPASTPAAPAAPASAPRPISAAERAAVALALDYAGRGPAAFWDRLADDSPLRALGRESALAEIGARAGPTAGASWRLQTPARGVGKDRAVFTVEFASGVDETLVLELVEQGAWKLRSLRTLVDPAPQREAPPPSLPGASALPRESAGPSAGRLGALAFALALAGAVARARRRAVGCSRTTSRKPAFVVTAVAGTTLTALALACAGTSEAPAPDGLATTGVTRLGELVPLRRALAAGDDAGLIARELAKTPGSGSLVRVRDLWRAQLALEEGDLVTAERSLEPVGPDEPLPLEELLRARLALQRLETRSTGLAYERALRAGIDHDGLRLEAIVARALTEEDEAALVVDARRLVELGSRAPEPWYIAAVEAARIEHDDESAELLRAGWSLRPVPRDELLDDPALAAVVARPAVFSLLELDSPAEPTPAAVPGSRPLATAGSVAASLCGSELRLDSNAFELLVPGGADLAPVGVRGESAAERRRRVAERGLAARPAILAAARAGGRPGPRLLRLAGDAADALAERRAWTELIALTDDLAVPEKNPPQKLVRLRAQALERVGRDAESLEALMDLAEREVNARRPAPGVLFDLADALARRGDYERAIRLVQRADSRLPVPRGDARLRQFEMSRDLAGDARSYRSAHFDIRFPRHTGERYARQLATVFEAERERLLRWIPRPGGRRVTVELFPVERFLSSYGGEVVGVTLLDGPVRLPFADLESLRPELVAILSHELAHAMLDGATAGRAPHWFHEGLAQHVQMGVGPVNPLPDLERTGRSLSVPALEPVIAGFAESQLVDIAYAESAWVIGFIEARWGLAALHRLQSSFAADRTEEEAIAAVTGLGLADFDAAFRRWATGDAPRARSVEVRRYDLELDSPLDVETGEAELPRVAAARPVPPPSPSAAVGPAEMAGWHRLYAGQSAAVKKALSAVMAALRTGSAAPDPSACGQLAQEAERLLGDAAALSAPDPAVAAALRDLYLGFSALGASCGQGRVDEARRHLEAGQSRLAHAARVLAPYGLRP